MNITKLASSTVIIETLDTSILCDPWIENGEYYGSWHHPTKIKYDSKFLNDITHIYLSHIHPDHFSRKTFEKLNKKIPVLIHNYESKFLKFNVERFGFKVIELDHNKEYSLDTETKIKIYAADNCNPELCFKFSGCADFTSKEGNSQQIDTLSIVDDGKNVLMNVNDCPIELAQSTFNDIKNNMRK